MPDFGKTFREADKMGLNRRRAANARIRYLKEKQSLYTESSDPAARIWEQEILDEINYLNRFWKVTTDQKKITEQDIEQARNYPIDRLIDFKNHKAYAWCHEDNSPSLGHLTRLNKAKCYVCDKPFDSIDVVMHQNGVDFITAVKILIGE